MKRSSHELRAAAPGIATVATGLAIYGLHQARHWKHAALHDELTGAYNRRGLNRAVSRLGQPHGILITDLDNFKEVNDEYGHARGDAVLKASARILIERLRADDIVSRPGGDEFTAVLSRPRQSDLTPLQGLAHVIKDVKTGFGIYVAENPDLQAVGFGASIGGVLIEEGMDFDAAHRLADQSLYADKALSHALQGQHR